MRRKQQPEQRITALYARLSRDDEKEGILGSIQNQRTILEKYASDNHLPNPRFFFDDGLSGAAAVSLINLSATSLISNGDGWRIFMS